MRLLEIPLMGDEDQLKNVNLEQLTDEVRKFLPDIAGLSFDQTSGRNTEINVQFRGVVDGSLKHELTEMVLEALRAHTPAPVLTVKAALRQAQTDSEKLAILEQVISRRMGHEILN